MKTPLTLSRYLAKNYTLNFLALLLGLLAIIYLFDTVELIRRGSKQAGVPLTLIFQMGLLKLPEVGQMLLPFAVLFSAMFTFWQLAKRHELVVMRAAGFSVWQFLAPIVGVGLSVGLLYLAIINPIGALLLQRFEQLERIHLRYNESQIAVFKEGLWLRQSLHEEEEKPSSDYIILHAAKIDQNDWTLKKVLALHFDAQDRFIERLDAQTARLEPNKWVFSDVTLHHTTGQSEEHDTMSLPTTLTIEDIEDSFASPETMAFWNLPGYIDTLEQTGFDASRLRVYYHTLLAQPLMFVAMILIAAAVALRPPRFRGAFGLIALGIFIGFGVFFVSSFLQTMGASQKLPVPVAAWSPALISLMLGISVLMNLEDG